MTSATRKPSFVAVAVVGAALVALVAVVACNSVPWVGSTFPSFLVMRNRVVASVTLGDWLSVPPARIFQNQITAVDGVPVGSSRAVYEAVQQRPVGAPIAYVLRAPSGATHTEVVASRRFSGWDYARLFGAYLLTGLAFAGTGLIVFVLKPESAAARGLLCCGLLIGLYAITGADLYGPHWFFRLHVAAETLATASLIHLALVFPTDRLRGRSRGMLAAVYAPFVILTIAYELSLSSPSSYTAMHLIAFRAQGFGAAALIGSTAWAFWRSRSPLIRRRIGVVALGTFAAFLVPGVLSASSVLLGGSVPANFQAFTVFLFPVSLGYAILREDLFEIDAVLRHATSYVVLVLAIGAAYALMIFLAGRLVPSSELVANAPFVLGVVNTVLVFVIVPLRVRTQAAVDRLFFRHSFDVRDALSELGDALASVGSIAGVIEAAEGVLAKTLSPRAVALWLRESDGRFERQGNAAPDRTDLVLAADLVARLGAGAAIARYEWDDGSGRPLPAIWHEIGAELIVPIRDAHGLVGILALGRRRSGRAYSGPDVAFLRTVASQMALAIEDARLLRRLEDKQASLMRADRLATIGRLTSGLAHEMGSPIGAVLSSLHILDQLGQEYAASIDQPTVTADDHREIAAEMIHTARKATEWAERASGFLRGITRQSREPRSGVRQRFPVATVVGEIATLLGHRLRASSVRLDFEEDPAQITVLGDPTALGQVLANLVGNAIDAYEDSDRSERSVQIRAVRREGQVVLTVRDWAGGMPPEVLERIFDELYTTKEVGRGTGLGLWISHNLIEQNFGGTLRAEAELGVGSCFTTTLPDEECAGEMLPAA